MAQHAHLDDKLAFTSPNFNPVLALKSKELAEKCSKARPFDNLRQYVASLQQSESFKSLGWFPKEFGHVRVTGKRPSKRKASFLHKPGSLSVFFLIFLKYRQAADGMIRMERTMQHFMYLGPKIFVYNLQWN